MISTITQSKRCSPIGLDMGSYALRAAQLRRSGASFVVSHTSQLRRREPGALVVPALADELQACFEQVEFAGRPTVTALNVPQVECFMLELPKAGASDRAEMVRWEVERLSAQDGDGVETDYWALPNTNVMAPDVIGVAAQREIVQNVLSVCHKGGKRCVRIDAAACALARFGCQLNDWGHKDLWGILDLGFLQSRLVLCLEETPILVRNVGVGGGKWTTLIADSLTVSEKTAEVHKQESGIAAISSSDTPVSNRPGRTEVPSMLLGILRSTFNDLASEIKRSYDYMLSCYPGRRAADLVLVGGGASMPNLPPFMSEALGIKVRPASNFLSEKSCRLSYASARQNRVEEFAQAIGSALNE